MQNRSYSTKSIVEAGLVSTLIVIIMLANLYVPMVSILGTLALPIPVTVLYIRHNFKVSLSAVIVSSIIVAMISNPLMALRCLIVLSTTGITLGYCIKHKKSNSLTLIMLTLASAVAITISLVIIVNLAGKHGIIDFISNQLQESIKVARQMYVDAGLTKEQLALLDNMAELAKPNNLFKNLLLILCMSGFFSASVNYYVTRVILKKLKYDVVEVKSFIYFYVNSKVAAIMAIFILIGVLLTRNNISIGSSITTSGYGILLILLLLDGVAFALYYLKNKFNMSKLVLTLILVFTIFSPLYIVFIYLGLMDILLDFRKLDPHRRRPIEK
ncbi:YybS family protein [Clostridium sp. P21]|uniref:YybS family protein n=1 Tax=Clostridium muellerianum TaxID=2716538 RepID=A0A7Y0HMD0_9CLOT|nr:YybS family protein [Clostridium muellerianum]NMM62055.1 YybS family protein [Clostridium muellerianum]